MRRELAAGAAIGAANGLFGGGGGMIAVPVLEKRLPPARAHATAIAAVLPATAVSAIVYAVGGFFRLPVLLPVSIGAAAGGAIGARLLKKLPDRITGLLFSLLMFAAGMRMLFP